MADFELFVALHAEHLLRTAYIIVWDEGEAEDVVQEALLRVSRRWSRVARMRHPGAYARRVVVNVALDGARERTRRRSELNPAAAGEQPAATPALDFSERSELLTALGRLSDRQRTVLVLRFFCDLTESETASVLGCPQGTVKSATSRALGHLREALQGTRQPTRSA